MISSSTAGSRAGICEPPGAWKIASRQTAPKNHGRAPLNTPSWAQQEYDLLCNKDTHTNGHVQWFYFGP